MFTVGDDVPIGGIYKKEIEDYIPYRTLSMQRTNVMFYQNAPLPIRTQEQNFERFWISRRNNERTFEFLGIKTTKLIKFFSF